MFNPPDLHDLHDLHATTVARPALVADGSAPVILVAAAFLLGVIARDSLGDAAAFRSVPPPGEAARACDLITPGEARVLPYLVTSLSAREIADELYVSANTVKTHVRHMYQKLGAHSRTEAIGRARALGLLAPSPRRPLGKLSEAAVT
jgi:DNA-binding NarL/FixJ family response regulator